MFILCWVPLAFFGRRWRMWDQRINKCNKNAPQAFKTGTVLGSLMMVKWQTHHTVRSVNAVEGVATIAEVASCYWPLSASKRECTWEPWLKGSFKNTSIVCVIPLFSATNLPAHCAFDFRLVLLLITQECRLIIYPNVNLWFGIIRSLHCNFSYQLHRHKFSQNSAYNHRQVEL